jgi:hypothetical protein
VHLLHPRVAACAIKRLGVVQRLLSPPAMKLASVFSISLCLLVACGNESKPNSAPAPPATPTAKAVEPTPAPEPAAPPFASEAGRYTQRVTFGTPKDKQMDDPNGGTWETTTWSTRGGMYVVQYTDYKDHAHAVAEVAGFIPTRTKSDIHRDEAVKIGTRDGRELEVAVNPTTTMWVRFIIDGKRVYKLVGATKGDAETPKKFFEGFEITTK